MNPTLLVTIPHYFGPRASTATHGSSVDQRDRRSETLKSTIFSLFQTLSDSQVVMQIVRGRTTQANQDLLMKVSVTVCTTPENHLLSGMHLPLELNHHVIDCPPMQLGYACHDVLAKSQDQFDWYLFIEDDILIRDPMFVAKAAWFQKKFGDEKLLQPNRFEVHCRSAALKAYVDGDIRLEATKAFQDIHEEPEVQAEAFGAVLKFIRPSNPHAGCFLLSRKQLKHWINHPAFSDRSSPFIGPLESAASYSIMNAFQVYKPAPQNAGFFEVEHQSTQFISLLRRPAK